MSRWSLLLCFFLVFSCSDPEPQRQPLSVAAALGGEDLSGYARAIEPHSFTFPADHNAHPEYKNEWWYFTGNLVTPDGRPFGYQVTFFRIALSPQPNQRTSNWATNQVWMAHAAITDINEKKHHKLERFARGAVGLAGNTASPFRVWLEDWSLSSEQGEFPWTIHIEDKEFSLQLSVSPKKQVVLQGDKGLSQKSPIPGNASYYFSFTRLKTEGQIILGEKKYPVSGLSWFDREWGTSLLGEDQSGWDWFSLQFNSGEDLMFYQLRDKAGKPHPNSLGSWVKADGTYMVIEPTDIRLKPVKWWTSPNGAKYPLHWEMNYLSANKTWLVKAALDDQLMDVSVQYWEGAVNIFNLISNEPIGKGYLEMTGY